MNTPNHAAYELLVAAGAPELPLGFAYRVKQERDSDHIVRVEVRKDSGRIGTECLAWSTFSTRDGDTALDAAVRACVEAHTDAFPIAAKEAAQ